jgi:hypothetical protein
MKRKADFEPEHDLETVKRRRLETLDYFSLLPDGLVELVLSKIYRIIYTNDEGVEVEVFNASLRLVSPQFRRVIDDSVPCFAMLKLLKSECQRVSNSDGSIDSNKTSPWLTHSEVSMILSKRQIDLNEPLPGPRLMPLTALQIVASTLAFEYQNRCPNIEIIYVAAGSIVFVQTVLQPGSPLNGKKIIVQQRRSLRPEGSCFCCWSPHLITRFCVTDHETASQLGVAINAQYDYDEYVEWIDEEGYAQHERRFSFDLEQYQSILERCWFSDIFAEPYEEETSEPHVFLMDMQYRRDKTFYTQFPTLPPSVYQALTQHNDNTVVLLESLRNVIEMFKLNVIFKSHTSAMMRKFYGSTFKSQNVEHLIADIKIIRRGLGGISALFKSYSINNLAKSENGDYFEREAFYATENDGITLGICSITDSLLSLRLQRDIGLPVPLTPADFQFMLQILISQQESLSTGFVFGVCHNEARWQNETAVVQILDVKKLTVPGKEEKYRIILSDGVYCMHGVLFSQLSHYVHNTWSLIKLTQYSVVDFHGRKLLLVLDIHKVRPSFPHIIGSPKNVDTNATYVQHQKPVPFPTKVIRTTECDLPLDAKVYTYHHQEARAAVHCNTLFSRQYGAHKETVAIQLLCMKNKHWFRVRVLPGEKNGKSTEIMKEYELSTAIELFEYWFNNLALSWNEEGTAQSYDGANCGKYCD